MTPAEGVLQKPRLRIGIGLIGAGGRGRVVYRDLASVAAGRARLVSLYDPDPQAAVAARRLPGARDALTASDWRTVIEHPAVDAVLIASPNADHVAPALATMESGKPLYLEKPLAATRQGHARLRAASRRTEARVAVGFVLRYAPFYRALKQHVASGAVGDIVHLHAVEAMGIGLTANVYLRNWRARKRRAGPLLLEKCCHDIDVINWLIDKPCESVYSISERTVFVPRADRPSHCRDCTDAACPYRATATVAEPSVDARGKCLDAGPRDDCVFNAPKDIADHTTLLARYAGGVHVTFNVTMGAAQGGRRMHIIGTRGEMWGCAEESCLFLRRLGDRNPACRIALDQHESSGHYGGDRALADLFLRMIRDPEVRPMAGIEDGYRSGIVCLAAEQSARTGRPVMLKKQEGSRA